VAVPDEQERTVVLHEPDRMVFFSDAVVAIAMTLLALELPVPAGNTVAEVLAQVRENAADYGAFVLSFFVVGSAWQAHHQLFTYIKRIDVATIGRNLQWLLLIVVTPFVTKLMTGGTGESDDLSSSLRLACYGFVQALTWFTLLRIYLHLRHRDLLTEDAPAPLRGWLERRVILIGMFVISVPLAFVTPWAAAACWIGSPFVVRGVFAARSYRARRAGR
jgi:uncharacterized membrane protein